jgi:tetratricopeptide (TPR) repeat protein
MLASFWVRQGQMAEAEAEYKAAISLSPAYAPGAANLADLYRQLGRDADAEDVLRKALEASPQDAGLHHVLGLTLVRLKRPTKQSASCAKPRSWTRTAHDTPMSMQLGSIQPDVGARPPRSSRKPSTTPKRPRHSDDSDRLQSRPGETTQQRSNMPRDWLR